MERVCDSPCTPRGRLSTQRASPGRLMLAFHWSRDECSPAMKATSPGLVVGAGPSPPGPEDGGHGIGEAVHIAPLSKRPHVVTRAAASRRSSDPVPAVGTTAVWSLIGHDQTTSLSIERCCFMLLLAEVDATHAVAGDGPLLARHDTIPITRRRFSRRYCCVSPPHRRRGRRWETDQGQSVRVTRGTLTVTGAGGMRGAPDLASR